MGKAWRIRSPGTAAEWAEYFRLRWRLLRAPWGAPRGSECDEIDDSGQGILHLGAYLQDGRLVAVGRLHRIEDELGQIRYMAVEPAWRGRGIGRALLRALEDGARAQGLTRIRLNAREPAAAFYLRAGYRELGPGPTIYATIRHREMDKAL